MTETSKHNIEKRRRQVEKWVPLNRRYNDKAPRDVTTFVVGWLVVALVVGVAAAQIGMHYGWFHP